MKFSYFDGDYNNDLLLKFVICLYDPFGKIKETCFPEALWISGNRNLPINIISNYVNDLRLNSPKKLDESSIDQSDSAIEKLSLEEE